MGFNGRRVYNKIISRNDNFVILENTKQGRCFKISTIDLTSVIDACSWYIDKNGYVVGGNRFKLHHWLLGKPSKGFVIDHIDGDKTNNTRENLRIVTYNCNSSNVSRSKLKFMGVSTDVKSKKFRARYRSETIGYFNSELKAAIAYDLYVSSISKDYTTNFSLGKYSILDLNSLGFNSLKDISITDLLDDKLVGISEVRGKFISRIKYKGKPYFLGSFSNLEEAILAREKFILDNNVTNAKSNSSFLKQRATNLVDDIV